VGEWLSLLTSDHNPSTTDMGSWPSVKVYRNVPMDVGFTDQIVVLIWSSEDYSFDPQSS